MANPKQPKSNPVLLHLSMLPSSQKLLGLREIKPTLQMAPYLSRTIRRRIHANSQTIGQTWNALGRVSHTTPPLGVQDEK
jgi:hypothetical protein